MLWKLEEYLIAAEGSVKGDSEDTVCLSSLRPLRPSRAGAVVYSGGGRGEGGGVRLLSQAKNKAIAIPFPLLLLSPILSRSTEERIGGASEPTVSPLPQSGAAA